MYSCVTAVPWICATWDSSVQFWELIATVLFTAAATGFTVWISVRESRRATMRALDEDRQVRAEERAEELRRLRERDANLAIAAVTSRIEWPMFGYGKEPSDLEPATPDWHIAMLTLRNSPVRDSARLADWLESQLAAWYEPTLGRYVALADQDPSLATAAYYEPTGDVLRVRERPDRFVDGIKAWMDDSNALDGPPHSDMPAPTDPPQPTDHKDV